MASWVRSFKSPFKKAASFFNSQQRDKKSPEGHEIQRTMDLQGEVMACGYEDVQVMWSILDKSKTRNCNLSH